MVHFVGAGPGAEDLITVRGLKLVGNADVIIYAGSLVKSELERAAKAREEKEKELAKIEEEKAKKKKEDEDALAAANLLIAASVAGACC